MDYLIYIVLLFEFAAAISATVYYKKYKSTPLKWMLPLLWYIAINEFTCHILLAPYRFEILYNFYEVIVCLGLLIITRLHLSHHTRIAIANVLIVVSAIAFTITAITQDPFKDWPVFSFTLSTILIIIALTLYLVEQLKSNKIAAYTRDIFLWVCIGFLIFHISYPVIMFSRYFLVMDSVFIYEAIFLIQFIAVIACYGTIAFGFYRGVHSATLIKRIL